MVLEALPLRDDEFTGAFIDTRQQAAQHNSIRTRCDSLGDITGILNATIADNWYSVLPGNTGAIIDGRYLRHADAGNDPRCTDRPSSDSNLDCIGASLDDRLGCLIRHSITGHQLHLLAKTRLYLC